MADLTTMKNKFTKADIGASVVFAGFDGGSYSAKIVVIRERAGLLGIRYLVPERGEACYAWLDRADWGRLTRFGNAKFLVLAS